MKGKGGSRPLSVRVDGERYLRELASHGLRPATIKTYRYHLKWFGLWLAAKKIALGQVTKEVAERWLEHMTERELEPKSRRDSRSVLRGYFAWLVDQRRIRRSPFAAVRPIKVPRKLPGFLQLPDALKIVGAAAAEVERVILELGYGSGLRRSEMTGIELEDLHLESTEIRIRGKGGTERMAPICPQAVQAIRDWLPVRAEILQRQKDGRAYAPRAVYGETRALLVTREGAMCGQTLVNHVKKVAARAGIDWSVYPHLFRHSFATHMLNNGEDLRRVQELLGHARLSTTQVYTHVATEDVREAYYHSNPRARMARGLPASTRRPDPPRQMPPAAEPNKFRLVD